VPKPDVTRWSGQGRRDRGGENIGLSLGVAMSRREFIDVVGGDSIAWSLAFPDASGQELRKAYRAGFLALSQLK
jgi:hypothetical protein